MLQSAHAAQPVWIVTAGAWGRDYSREFYRFGMAFVGGDDQRATIRRIQAGDIILLKSGISKILAAGKAVERHGVVTGDGDKDWLRDVDGWDLPAYCYVKWHVSPQPVPVKGLARGTIYQSTDPNHLALATQLLNLPAEPDPEEPAPTEPVDDEEILWFLIENGLPVSKADEVTKALRHIRWLARYYHKSWWEEVREHETRTFLVTPLLLALGWAEQQLKIELPMGGGIVDVACFPGPYTGKKDDAVALLEAKGFAQGLSYATDQARWYGAHFPKCKVLIVTNGFCYKTFVRDHNGAFPTTPTAYLNLLRPRNRYPLDPQHVGGALDVLGCLLPAKLLRSI